MRVGRAIALVGALAILTGCYRQVVNTGRAPSPTVVNRPWTATWVFGLVPAQAIDVTQQCPGGIATVTTQLTVPNWLVSAVTLGLYTPRNVSVGCAQGTAMRGLPSVDVAQHSSRDDVEAALKKAAVLSAQLGQSVIVRF